MSDQTLNLTPALYQYILQHSLRETSLLTKLREETHRLPGSVMQISPEQGQFMRLLVELMQAKKIIDIGTFTGYSALCFAMAMQEGGQVITCDINNESSAIAKRYFIAAKLDQKIHLALAPAKETLQNLLDEGHGNSFDIIFIDADKNNYPVYYEQALQLLRKRGLLLVDNVLWSGRVSDLKEQDQVTKMFREFNDRLLNDDRITLSMLPVGDGLTLALKR